MLVDSPHLVEVVLGEHFEGASCGRTSVVRPSSPPFLGGGGGFEPTRGDRIGDAPSVIACRKPEPKNGIDLGTGPKQDGSRKVRDARNNTRHPEDSGAPNIPETPKVLHSKTPLPRSHTYRNNPEHLTHPTSRTHAPLGAHTLFGSAGPPRRLLRAFFVRARASRAVSGLVAGTPESGLLWRSAARAPLARRCSSVAPGAAPGAALVLLGCRSDTNMP